MSNPLLPVLGGSWTTLLQSPLAPVRGVRGNSLDTLRGSQLQDVQEVALDIKVGGGGPVQVSLDADVRAGVVLSHNALHVWHGDRWKYRSSKFGHSRDSVQCALRFLRLLVLQSLQWGVLRLFWNQMLKVRTELQDEWGRNRNVPIY